MNPEYAGAGAGAAAGGNRGWRWKQMGDEERKAAVSEEMNRMRRLPPSSAYASHRLRVLNKIHQLLALQRTTSQDEELELLFSGLHL